MKTRILTIVLAAALTGCSGDSAEETTTQTPEPTPTKSLMDMKATGTPKKQAKPATVVKAETGVGKKGRGYGGGIYTEPVRAKFHVEQTLVFNVQIPHMMRSFKAINERYPKSHEEYMEKIIQEGQIQLPELPAGETYLYDPETQELMVTRPSK